STPTRPCRPSGPARRPRRRTEPGSAPACMADPVTDTIVAVATPPGVGGVGIVRMSGPAARVIARELCGGRTLRRRSAHHVRFLAADGEPIDDGIALLFAGPASYTGEDVVE